MRIEASSTSFLVLPNPPASPRLLSNVHKKSIIASMLHTGRSLLPFHAYSSLSPRVIDLMHPSPPPPKKKIPRLSPAHAEIYCLFGNLLVFLSVQFLHMDQGHQTIPTQINTMSYVCTYILQASKVSKLHSVRCYRLAYGLGRRML